jgi:hypothetical protein
MLVGLSLIGLTSPIIAVAMRLAAFGISWLVLNLQK